MNINNFNINDTEDFKYLLFLINFVLRPNIRFHKIFSTTSSRCQNLRPSPTDNNSAPIKRCSWLLLVYVYVSANVYLYMCRNVNYDADGDRSYRIPALTDRCTLLKSAANPPKYF